MSITKIFHGVNEAFYVVQWGVRVNPMAQVYNVFATKLSNHFLSCLTDGGFRGIQKAGVQVSLKYFVWADPLPAKGWCDGPVQANRLAIKRTNFGERKPAILRKNDFGHALNIVANSFDVRQ